ncbi:hypothetical protein MAHJHV64_24510 [Mycobacterium avium subsp. hominissuis]|jgi:hypothetical protein|uniref:Uncharacterized protein n=2 Tax=Mycobacterium avium complex (MAC) TaxID=120793 RepID=A0A3B6X586_MYCAV|nr:hypothetical protein DFS55_05745 [Mycobacterium avium subsp. hominissuis]AYJ06485.1 hypothetical protein DBO90_18005 [Mycobacterium avium]KBR60919.1 hypothetical protein X425_03431 [Mycobacterium avium XTB13-223]ORA55900.1 hypothetical protein BST19_05585 [Mycobacterium bouchedurhonense]QGW33756.1 hypothetical protein MAA44156_03587 [Mycobacterium avium subsp. avium]TXA40419.1 hypothetical protein DKM27_19565 [Mycobacterium tuberculosis variant bovis]
MIGNAFGVGVARATRPAPSAAGLPAAHAAHAAALAAARKHRAAAATDASVRVGGPPKAR